MVYYFCIRFLLIQQETIFMPVTIIKTIKYPDRMTLKKWCDDTGDTPNAVYQRISSGKWLEGIQFIKVEGKIWIEYKEAQKWLQNPKMATLQALKELK